MVTANHALNTFFTCQKTETPVPKLRAFLATQCICYAISKAGYFAFGLLAIKINIALVLIVI